MQEVNLYYCLKCATVRAHDEKLDDDVTTINLFCHSYKCNSLITKHKAIAINNHDRNTGQMNFHHQFLTHD